MVWKTLMHLVSHSPEEVPFNKLKNGRKLFEYLEMNMFRPGSFFG